MDVLHLLLHVALFVAPLAGLLAFMLHLRRKRLDDIHTVRQRPTHAVPVPGNYTTFKKTN